MLRRFVLVAGMSKLVPPDRDRCQAEKPTGGPFMIGGEIGNPLKGYLARCRNTPTVIATEAEPGSDGKRGSMSLCDGCRKVLVEQCGIDFATFREIR